jgi:hypothetical protein
MQRVDHQDVECHRDSPAQRTVYVLGSGPSLLAVSAAERAHIAGQLSVGMNKYLLFWERAGILPTHFFLADRHYPAVRVYEESVLAARDAGRPVHFLLDAAYGARYGGGPLKRMRNMPWSLALRWRHGFRPALACVPEQATYFTRWHGWNDPKVWARSLHEKMFFHRGSLSCLLNLLCVLRLGEEIKLLGVDLNTPRSFYDDAIADREYLHDEYMRMQAQGDAPMHMTAAPYRGMGGIQEVWPFIQTQVEAAGIRLVCCSPTSLLVEEELCPYAPVIE